MTKKLSIFLIPLVISTLFSGCAKEKKEVKPPKVDRFRTRSTRLQTQDVEVVCHNCTAKFKTSFKLQKLAMKGGTKVICPHCHHDYLHKAQH